MRALFAFAVIVLASSAAQAQYTFDYGGRTIRIDPDRGTISIPGVYDNSGPRSRRSHNDEEINHPRKRPSQQTRINSQAPDVGAVRTEQAPAPVNPSSEPSTATANVVPADTSTSTQPPASAPAPQVEQDAAPLAKLAPAPVVATAPAQPTPAPATSAVPSATSPVGLWSTEEKEGKVRIEPCGPNLCGYSVDARSSQNGEQVLINMKPGKDAKWHGRIHDPKTGSNYNSTIALKGPEFLRVQGCAFGGMFCGGQTWKRVS